MHQSKIYADSLDSWFQQWQRRWQLLNKSYLTRRRQSFSAGVFVANLQQQYWWWINRTSPRDATNLFPEILQCFMTCVFSLCQSQGQMYICLFSRQRLSLTCALNIHLFVKRKAHFCVYSYKNRYLLMKTSRHRFSFIGNIKYLWMKTTSKSMRDVNKEVNASVVSKDSYLPVSSPTRPTQRYTGFWRGRSLTESAAARRIATKANASGVKLDANNDHKSAWFESLTLQSSILSPWWP